MQKFIKKILSVTLIVVIAIAAAIGGWFLYRNFFSRASTPVGTEGTTLSLESSKDEYHPGETITVDVKIDTQSTEIATVGGEIGYPEDKLEFKSVNTDNSKIKLWLDEPKAENGKITFLGSTNEATERKTYTTGDSDPASLMQINLTVKAGVTGDVTVSFGQENNATAVFTADIYDGEASEKIVHNVLIETKEKTYTITEQTEPLAPTVTDFTPANNATDVAIDTTVVATFSEEVTGVDNTSFYLTETSNTDKITAAVVYENKIATLTPAAKLKKDTDYTATILADKVKDVNDNLNLAENYVSSFKTAIEQGEKPLAPTNVKAEGTDNNIKVTWTKSDNASGYKVLYRLAGSEYADDTKIDAGDVAEHIFNVDEDQIDYGNKYYFAVVAYNDAGDSPKSEEDSARALINGDLDTDKDVDLADHQKFAWCIADFNKNSLTDLNDLADMADDEGKAKPDGDIDIYDLRMWISFYIDWTAV